MSTTSMTTGWPTFDQIEGGFRKGELTIFCAKPSNIPKSNFTQSLAATHCKKPMVFLNYEGRLRGDIKE
jgi:hypothetical protein